MTDLDLETCEAIAGGATDDLWKFFAIDDWESPVAGFADAFPAN